MMKDANQFLVECSDKKVLERLADLKLISKTAARNVNMYFKYESYLRSGHNTNGAVFLTARFFSMGESTVYKIVKKIERELE